MIITISGFSGHLSSHTDTKFGGKEKSFPYDKNL